MPSVLLFASYSAPCFRRRNTACGTSVVEGRLGGTPLILPKQQDAKQRPLTGRHGNGLSRRVGSRPVRPLYDRDGWRAVWPLSAACCAKTDIGGPADRGSTAVLPRERTTSRSLPVIQDGQEMRRAKETA